MMLCAIPQTKSRLSSNVWGRLIFSRWRSMAATACSCARRGASASAACFRRSSSFGGRCRRLCGADKLPHRETRPPFEKPRRNSAARFSSATRRSAYAESLVSRWHRPGFASGAQAASVQLGPVGILRGLDYRFTWLQMAASISARGTAGAGQGVWCLPYSALLFRRPPQR